MALNTLGESNEITLRWIPAHCGYEGNELADQLAKRGSNNDRATRIKLPMPRCVCYAALRRKTIVSWIESYKLNPPKMFNILWRDKFSKDLIRMNKRDLRAATQILTGHACLNYHLSKLNRSVQPLCPLCEAEYDTQWRNDRPCYPCYAGGGTLGGRHITEFTVFKLYLGQLSVRWTRK